MQQNNWHGFQFISVYILHNSELIYIFNTGWLVPDFTVLNHMIYLNRNILPLVPQQIASLYNTGRI